MKKSPLDGIVASSYEYLEAILDKSDLTEEEKTLERLKFPDHIQKMPEFTTVRSGQILVYKGGYGTTWVDIETREE